MGVEEEFEKLKKESKNNMDSVIAWMKDAKVINEKLTEEQARNLVKPKDPASIDMEEFKEMLAKSAKEHDENINEIYDKMAATTSKVTQALKVGVSAFVKALTDE